MYRRGRCSVRAGRGFREGTIFLRSTLRREAELGHHPQVVMVVPDLRDLAALESRHEDVGESNGFARCGHFLNAGARQANCIWKSHDSVASGVPASSPASTVCMVAFLKPPPFLGLNAPTTRITTTQLRGEGSGFQVS